MSVVAVELYAALTKAGVADDDARSVADALDQKIKDEVATKHELLAMEQRIYRGLYQALFIQSLSIIGAVVALTKLLA